ncbi:hypothetical protein ABTF85_19315, partial [Acinetobacter baumannii]
GLSSGARNARMVLVVLTAALVLLQLVGLAMMERSHAGPASRPSADVAAPAQCPGAAPVSATPALYD